jgi:(R,R)-butanediol dehydrogenase/meso-butanediol dehydrogenase/diacetyl reductase
MHTDFVSAMRSLADGSVDAGPLITGTVGLDELPALLAELDGRKNQHAKVLVGPNGCVASHPPLNCHFVGPAATYRRS